MTDMDPIQAQLIAARKNQILDAAAKVFAEKGFPRATIKDVARAAGIADGTIYNYFENKEALLAGIWDRMNRDDETSLKAAIEEGTPLREYLRKSLQEEIDYLQPHLPEVFRVLLSEMLVNKNMRDKFYQNAKPGYSIAEQYAQMLMERGEIQSTDSAMTTRLIASVLFGMVMLMAMGDEYLLAKEDQLVDAITEFVLHGVHFNDDR
jgi:AcrR family transcriptional regulator